MSSVYVEMMMQNGNLQQLNARAVLYAFCLCLILQNIVYIVVWNNRTEGIGAHFLLFHTTI